MSVTRPDLSSSEVFSVRGKTAIVTGASGFLGRTFVRALLANGARVVALGRSERLIREVETWKAEHGDNSCVGYQLDMFDSGTLASVLRKIVSEERTIDILVNNAHELGPATGFNVPSGSLENSDMQTWMRNLTGGVYWAASTTQVVGKRMQEQRTGSIINISTMYALVAPRPQLYADTQFVNPPAYSASKAALLSFTRYVASFWGSYGIRANAILPGPFSNTEDIGGPNSVDMESPFLQRLKAYTCLGRIGRPNELVGALLFLASDASSFMTGQSVVVDGGWTAV